MQTEKMKMLLYLKKSGKDKQGKAPIMGRITLGKSIVQFRCKLSCCYPSKQPTNLCCPKVAHLMQLI